MQNNPLKWPGGKSYLAKRIIELMPKHTHYVEPFFGGGAVLLAKPYEGISEVINDLNYRLTNFWKVLQDDELFSQFEKIINAVPFSEVEWECADPDNCNVHPRTPWSYVEDAVAFFIRYRQSRQGLGKDFATLSRNRVRRGMNEQASAWWSAVEDLPEAHERMKRVVILNKDACKVIQQQDGENTLFYCDPPYIQETRTAKSVYGEFEMTDEQHADFLYTIGLITGKFIVSGYRCKLYDNWAEAYGFNRVDIEIDNKASSSATKPIKTESLWMNY